MGKELVRGFKSTLASIRDQSPLKGFYNKLPNSRVTENNASTTKYKLGDFEVDVRSGFLELCHNYSTIFRFIFSLDDQGNLIGIGGASKESYGDKDFYCWRNVGNEDFLLTYVASPDKPTIFSLRNINKKVVIKYRHDYSYTDPDQLKVYMNKVHTDGMPFEVNALDVLLTYSTGQIHQDGQNTGNYLTGEIIASNPFITAQSSTK